MADELKKLAEYPDVSFIDAVSFSQLQEQMIKDYEDKYREETGKDISLAQADPYRLILYSCAVAVYQGYQYEDRAGKMGLLKYSTGDFLDNLAALKGVSRSEAKPAATKIRFTLSAALTREAVIPQGVRVKGAELYFETTEQGVIPAGDLYTDVPAVCQTSGTVGNGFSKGTINTLVDPQPYTLSVTNTEATSGGTERETDEELAERIYLAPQKYSTAGSRAAYEYWIKTFSSSISECKVTSEVPGEVDIYIMVDNELPEETIKKNLEAYLTSETLRPLTDKVMVKAPEVVDYEIAFTYYIRKSDKDMEESIKEAVGTACQNYIAWQKKIGRDITPSQLIYEIVKAGAQSAEITKPVYTEIQDKQVAVAGEPQITYGGLRDD